MPTLPSRIMNVRFVPTYPVTLAEGTGIGIETATGTKTIGLDYASVAATPGIADPATAQIVVYRQADETYELARLDQLVFPAAGQRTGRGDADYTILTTDRVVALTASLTAPRTWTLPAAADVAGGTAVDVIDEAGGIGSTNTLTITRAASDTINGATTTVLSIARSGVRLISDGISKWTINLIGTTQIADAAITTAKLADTAVTTAKVTDKAITLAKQADVATGVIMGRTTAGTGVQEALTPAQAIGILGLNGVGQCQLVRTSSSLLTLNRKNGNRLFINGALELIPATAPTLNVSGATAGTLYYIYAYMNSGTMTLEYSTTANATDATYGHQIKSGDATRTLVGMAQPTTGPAWTNSSTQAFVRSFFNRQPVALRGAFTALRTRASGSFGEVNSEIRVEFLSWEDERVVYNINGYAFTSGTVYGVVAGSIDGATPGTQEGSAVYQSTGSPIGWAGHAVPGAGYHYATLFALCTGGGTVTFDTASTSAYTNLNLSVGA